MTSEEPEIKSIVATIIIFEDGDWEYITTTDAHPLIKYAIEANMNNNWHEEIEHGVQNLDCVDLGDMTEEDAGDWYENECRG